MWAVRGLWAVGGLRAARGLWRKGVAAALVAVAAGGAMAVRSPRAAAAPTSSLYEPTASGPVLYAQGLAAGKAGAQGAVILDFGRPAYRAGVYGVMDYADRFVPLADVVGAVESYAWGYFRSAPSYTGLEVVMGTNDSCGTGQPCGSTKRCGCPDEPPSYRQWGRHFALFVEGTASWVADLRATHGYTDDVRVVAGDDAEPGFDPRYWNTYDLLAGYAATVGSAPTMVDFGDAAPGPWTEEQLYQVAYGFPPDVPFPEIYYPGQAAQWGALARYARAHHGKSMDFSGVLSQDPAGNTPAAAYSQLVAALAPVTGQTVLRWASEIGFG